MKRTITLLAVSIAIMLYGFKANAQCDRQLMKNKAKKELAPYHIEHVAMKSLDSFSAADRDTVEAEFWVYAKDRYKVINLSEGLSESLEFSISNPAGEIIFSNEKDAEKRTFKFVAEKSGKYLIRFIVGEKDQKAASGCISFTIGYALKAF